MKLDEILDMWDADTQMDRSELGEEARKIPRLHAKYLRLLTHEKIVLKSLESKFRKLWLEKQEYYVEGPSSKEEIDRRKGEWKKVPEARKMYVRSTVGSHLDADDDIDDLRFRKETVAVKIEALNTILESIMKRGFLINSMIQWTQWTGGGK